MTGSYVQETSESDATNIWWNQQRWGTVLVTDESLFHLSRADGRMRVWQHIQERYGDCNILERDPYGGVSVMVWAGISRNLKTELVIPWMRLWSMLHRQGYKPTCCAVYVT